MKDLSYYSNDRAEMKQFWEGINPSVVLEIGCGTCEHAKYFGRSVEYWGIEPCTEAYKLAKQNNYHVINSTFEEAYASLPSAYYDVVLVNDVIEHVIDHEQMLLKIKRLLKSNGAVVGSVPNLRHISVLYNLLYKRRFQYAVAGIMDSTHVRWFTVYSLSETLVSCGFRIKKIQGINPSIPGPIYKRLLLKSILEIVGHDILCQQIAFSAISHDG